ncbi:metal-dependent hydrolase family protein [Gryllotalpicola protaetiae]|uniref:Amidohydrolase family protein n=1 Tax=Gryllotalpicola protaetiae TaxID=2419771 RepID=A0A387BMR5_9MICO|nr:amidohydrolase family protein [Gryllotalpicola protaetiae]AYG02320.1 amidohydrolase family protein [Gryllotalpicola protaetiae]
MNTPFALTHATIVTGDETGTVLLDQTVSVGADGRIETVGPSAETTVATGRRQIDLTGKYLLPGLINAHAHLFADGKPLPAVLAKESLEGAVSVFFHSPAGKAMLKRRTRINVTTQLNSGVTTIRSLGDVGYEVVALREEIEAGRVLGPRLLAAGPLLAATGGHGAPLIALVGDNPWDARRNVRRNLRKGVTAIKIAATGGVTDARAIGEAGRPQMTEEEMAAICDEAHVAGILVAAHAQSREGVKRALRAGVDTIEHGCDMDDEMIGLFLENPRSLHGSSALVPTFQAALPLVKLDQSVTGINDIVRANAEMILARMIQGAADAVVHGITLGMGTDSALTYVTHYNTWRELDLAARYGGLTPTQALHAATQANARLLGLGDETGSVETGKSADLVVLPANPLEGFRAYADVELVVARGALIEKPEFTRFPEIDQQLDSF